MEKMIGILLQCLNRQVTLQGSMSNTMKRPCAEPGGIGRPNLEASPSLRLTPSDNKATLHTPAAAGNDNRSKITKFEHLN
jgi:hypothetical protein